MDSFHDEGVMPVIHIMIKRCRKEDLNAWGIMRNNSFGIPSEPVALLLRSFLRTVSKVCWRKTYGSSVEWGVRDSAAGEVMTKGSSLVWRKG